MTYNGSFLVTYNDNLELRDINSMICIEQGSTNMIYIIRQNDPKLYYLNYTGIGKSYQATGYDFSTHDLVGLLSYDNTVYVLDNLGSLYKIALYPDTLTPLTSILLLYGVQPVSSSPSSFAYNPQGDFFTYSVDEYVYVISGSEYNGYAINTLLSITNPPSPGCDACFIGNSLYIGCIKDEIQYICLSSADYSYPYWVINISDYITPITERFKFGLYKDALLYTDGSGTINLIRGNRNSRVSTRGNHGSLIGYNTIGTGFSDSIFLANPSSNQILVFIADNTTSDTGIPFDDHYCNILKLMSSNRQTSFQCEDIGSSYIRL